MIICYRAFQLDPLCTNYTALDEFVPWQEVDRSSARLGTRPDVVLLHNPELAIVAAAREGVTWRNVVGWLVVA